MQKIVLKDEQISNVKEQISKQRRTEGKRNRHVGI
jgi:hypothetical protein